MSKHVEINDVSDTSLWVAYYRAQESKRPDALFQDPYAERLAGERGRNIAENMKQIGRHTEFAVITRTVIIDDFIQRLVREGVDTVINLGAGLDSRPYRLNLPAELHWVEVDYPRIIEHKQSLLKNETPKCRLTAIGLDLANDEERKKLLIKACADAKSVLVLTEGVVPYLNEEQVTKLGQDLQALPQIRFWILEYFNAEVYKYLKASLRTKKMQKSPFLFYPPDWLSFFENLGWILQDLRYSGEEGLKVGRSMPLPWWGKIFMLLAPKKLLQKSTRMTGYLILRKKTIQDTV